MTKRHKQSNKCSFCKRSEKVTGELFIGPYNRKKGTLFTPLICEECARIVCRCFRKLEKNKNGGAESSGPAKPSGENPNE